MKDIIIITSVIKICNSALSYTKTRSVFNHEQRFNQTMDTIKSIRDHYAGYYIVLVEGTELPAEWEEALTKSVDHYCNIAKTYHKAVIDSASKGAGEASILLAYLTGEHFDGIKNDVRSISKISGRYFLTPLFIDIDKYLRDDKIIVNYNDTHKQIHTTWYCIHVDEIDGFIEVLKGSMKNDLFVKGNYSIENYLYDFWLKNKEFRSIASIGVSGKIAVDGNENFY